MEKISNQASCLIKTREYNVGFPGRFSHYPKNMDSERLEVIHKLVLEAMQDPISISKSEDGVRRIVIGDGKYMVLGVSGYLSSIMPDLSSEYNSFCDLSETRKTYGFAGFVWELKAGAELPQGFPRLSEFAKLFQMEILPHWKDSANSVWAENVYRGVQVPYSLEVHCQENDVPRKSIENRINTNRHKVAVFRMEKTELIGEAMFWASKGHEVSLCTDLDYYEESGTGFGNLCSYHCNQGKKLYDNIHKEARELKEDEFKKQRTDDDCGEIKSGTKWTDKNGETKSGQNNNIEEPTEKISVIFEYDLIYKNKEKAKRDYNRLYELMEECTRSVNGEVVYYGTQPDFWPEQLVKGLIKGFFRSRIICKVDFQSKFDMEKLWLALLEKIEHEKGKGKGCLRTVEPLNYYEEKQPGDKEHNPMETDGSTNKLLRKRGAQNAGLHRNDKKSDDMDSIEQFTKQLAGLYGNGEKELPPRSNDADSNSENPFSL